MQAYGKVLESSSHHGAGFDDSTQHDDGGPNKQESSSSSAQLAAADDSTSCSSPLHFLWHRIRAVYITITFSWVVPLLEIGNSRRLEPSDLYKLDMRDTASGCYKRFMEHWSKRRKTGMYSLRLTLSFFAAFGTPFMLAGAIKLCHDSLMFIGPQVLNKLIVFMKTPTQPVSVGLYYVAVLFVSQTLMSVFLRQYFFWCFRVGMRVRSAIITSVYAKTLAIATGAFTRKSTGEISNLMAVDSSRLQDLTPYLHAVWYSMYQIGLALYLLWAQVGAASLAAIVVIVLTIPLTGKVSNMLKNIQQKVVVVRDERIKTSNEVLSGIKVIKLASWESEYKSRINALRDKELSLFREYVLTQALSGTLFTIIPLLVAMSTFLAYTIFEKKPLDVATALTSLSLFDLLRFPLFMLPSTINSIVEAQVSVNRIQSFLLEDERVPVPSQSLKTIGLRLNKVTACWDGVGRSVDSSEPTNAGSRKEEEEEADQSIMGRFRVLTKWLLKLAGSTSPEMDDDGDVSSGNPLHVQAQSSATRRKKWERLDTASYDELLLKELARANEARIVGLEKQVQQLSLQLQETETQEELQDRPDVDSDSEASGPVSVGGTRLLALNRVSVDVGVGDLVAVIGPVAAAKSSLLHSVLGDLRLLFGDVACRGSLALVGQRPFIFNATVKDNILNGLAFDADRYQNVCDACALLPDFKVLPAGDATEIGERGITLSGGQKARVALARAMFADADVYLLDDVLSAVDSHTATHLFNNCILALQARGKAVLLSTNALQILPACTKVIVVDAGAVVQQGTYAQLRRACSGVFFDMMNAYTKSVDVSSSSGEEKGCKEEKEKEKLEAVILDGGKGKSSAAAVVSSSSSVGSDRAGGGKLVETEDREVGQVAHQVYLTWMEAAGGVYVGVGLIFLFMACEAANVSASIWLGYWSEHHAEHSSGYFLGIYCIICFSIAALMACREITTRLSSWQAGQSLFREFLHSTMYAPQHFFDTTPLGRVINRFSKDIYVVDESLPQTVRWYLQSLAKVIGAILYVCVVSPLFIIAMVPIVAFYRVTQAYYIKTSRELSRLDNISRSPIYALFGETIDGLSTVRAFRMEKELCRRIDSLLDENQRAYFLSFACNCWLAFRLEMAGTLIVSIAALLAVLGRPTSNGNSGDPAESAGAGRGTSLETYAGLAGLAISMCLSITQSINWSVRMASDLESQMVSVERLKEFISMKQEPPHYLPERDPPPVWPSAGHITFRNVSMRYREGLPLVLNGVSLDIKAKEKIGICGRTGSGKTSLVSALLRLVEICDDGGTITIDSVDVHEIGLHALRSRIAVIPQDPVLFSGSIRTNLDPFDSYTDAKIVDGLRRIGLSGCGLEDRVEENGVNFSVGTRQMICIARALLSNAKLIVMDEASSSVDVETDALIQRAIREEFTEATCLTVAHRLNTVLDSDRIVVLEQGRVVEFDTPSHLIARPDSAFASLVSNWEASHA